MISNQDSNMNMNSSLHKDFNLKKYLSIYFIKWKWFVLSCFICFCLAFIYIRYTTPKYEANAKILLINEYESSTASVFNEMGFYEGEEAKIDDEIQIIASRRFIKNVIKKLELNIQYYTRGRFYDSELYKKNVPININFIASDSIVFNTNFNFFIDINSEVGFDYITGNEDSPKSIVFGENIPTPFGGIIITPKEGETKTLLGKNLRVKISPVNTVADHLIESISVLPYGTASKILVVSAISPIEEKAKDIVRTLIDEYNHAKLEIENTRTKNTANFIDSRVELIASDLVNVDDSIVRFKTGNKITDVSSDAGQFLTSSTQNQQLLDQAKTEFRVLSYMEESLGTDSSSFAPIPSMNTSDPSITALSTRYSELLVNRERLLQSAGEKNLVIVEIDQSLNTIRQNLMQNIKNAKNTLSIRINSLESQSNRINSKIFSVPGQERKLRSIERKQGIKESLYLYLLEKREEAAIAMTAISPHVQIVDDVYSSGYPISPKKQIIYITALFLGFLIPFSIIYVDDLLDTKIHSKEDVEGIIKDITVLGEIPRLTNKEVNTLVKSNDSSLLSESFRIIRTNFDYVKRGRQVKEYNNILFVSSTINGEGKSFFSINMALTFANTNKRVLLIGADIRNPQIEFEPLKQRKKQVSKVGLTEYLSDDSILIGEAINTVDVGNIKIDVLLSGKIPPNPAELLMSERMKPLFDKVSEQYDYVIVDTAPAMLVTDTLLFSQYAGHTIFMTRANYSERATLNFVKDLHDKEKLRGMMLVVNDVNKTNFGYGVKYGEYGARKKKSFFKRF